MDLFDLFPKVVLLLRERNIPFAVAGGFAAGLYRMEPRVTLDVDLGIVLEGDSETIGRELLEELALDVGTLRAADLAGGPLFAIKKKSTPSVMLIGRSRENGIAGIDLLLPAIPWVREAVMRARENLADFGFGPLPVLRIEDVLLSKLYALSDKVRPKDLDDLQSIIDSGRDYDRDYLRRKIQTLSLRLPPSGKDLVPRDLRALYRGGN